MRLAWMIRCTGLGVIPGLVFASEPTADDLAHWHARDVARHGRAPDGTLRSLRAWAVPVCLAGADGLPLPEAPVALVGETLAFAAPRESAPPSLPEMTAAATGRVE